MKVNFKKNIVTVLILQLILSYFVVIFSTPVMAETKPQEAAATTKPKTEKEAEAETKAAVDTEVNAAETAAKANADINSGVTVKAGQSFDTILGEFDNPLEFKTVPELILRLINIGLLLAAMVSVIVIITGGFNLVTAMGNESKITKGKRSIMWAIGGLIICLMSFSIVAIIQKVIS